MSHHVFMICVENESSPVSLEIRKLYEILPDTKAQESGYLRVIDESGEDYLYPITFFEPVELSVQAEERLLHAA